MPISSDQLSEMLKKIRDQTSVSWRKLDQQFQADHEYASRMLTYYRTQRSAQPGPVLLSRTPGKTSKTRQAAVSTKVNERELAETSNQVSSSAHDHYDVPSSSKTLLPRRIKLECVESTDSDHDGSPDVLETEPFKVPQAPSKKLILSSSKSSSTPQQVSKPDQITSKISAAKLPSEIQASGDIAGARYPTRYSKRVREGSIREGTSAQSTTKTLVQERGRRNYSNSDESKILDEAEFTRESIGANTTYDIVTSTSINRTFEKKSLSKESIGANTTYVVDSQSKKSIRTYSSSSSKESIGANTTYVVDSQSKKSIRTYSSSSQDSPAPAKKSIGGNSTFTVDTSNQKKGSVPDMRAAELATDGPTSSLKVIPPKTVQNASAGKTATVASGSTVRKAAAGKTATATSGSTVRNASAGKTATVAGGPTPKNASAGKTAAVASCSTGGKALKKADCSSLKAARKSLNWAKEFKIKHLKVNNFENGSSQMVSNKQRTNFTNVLSSQRNMIKIQPSPLKAPPMPFRNSPAPPADHLAKLASKVLHVSKQSKQSNRSKVEGKKWNKNIPCNGDTDGLKTENEATFKVKILNEGLSFLSKGPTMPAQETAFPNAIKPLSSVLCKPSTSKSGTSSYDITLNPEDRCPLPAKSETDYGLDDVHSSDSSDDESQPKKVVPPWAQALVRSSSLQLQYNITSYQMFTFFESTRCTPDLTAIFENIDKRMLLRRSSAVWKSLEK